MVEYAPNIDVAFAALSDSIRRDILKRTRTSELTVNQIALDYDMSLAAVSKHLKVLAQSGLIRRRKSGRHVYVSANPEGLEEATEYLRGIDQLYEDQQATRKDNN